MGHRQEQQDGRLLVLGLEDRVEQLDGVVDLGEEVAVREGAALGAAGGAGGVDEGGEGVGAQHAAPYGDLGVRHLYAGLCEPGHVLLVHHPQVAQVGQVRQFGADGGGLGGGLGEQGDGAGVVQDPAGLEDRRGGVDRHGDQAGGPGGEVEQRPLVRRAGHDGDTVTRHQPLGDQPLGHRAHLLGEVRGRDVRPAAVGQAAAEHDGGGGRLRVVERQVREGTVLHRGRERRYRHLPHGAVEPLHRGFHEDRTAVVVGGGDGGAGGGGVVRVRGGHGRLLWRACTCGALAERGYRRLGR